MGITAKPPHKKNRGLAELPGGNFKSCELSAEDLKDLDAFCTNIQSDGPLDQAHFKQWQGVHTALDLEVPLFLTPQEAETGCDKEVRFSRSIRTGRSAPQREKTVILVIVPPGACEGQSFLYQGQGDRQDIDCGDVRICVRIRR